MAAQSFELNMEETKQSTPPTNGTISPIQETVTTSSSPSSSSSLNTEQYSESKKNAPTSLDASLLSPNSVNATVRTRRNNTSSNSSSGKSSVFQLVKSKATTSSLATSNIVSNNSTIDTTMNVFDDHQNSNTFEAADNHRDLEKTLPKIDLNRNLDLFGQSNSSSSASTSSSSIINRKENDETPIIAKPALEGKTKFANTKFGRLVRRIVNHIRVWARSPFIKYSVIVLVVLSLIGLLGMFVLPMFSSSSVDNLPPSSAIIRNEGTTEEREDGTSSGPPSLWQRITSVFSRSSEGGSGTDSNTLQSSGAADLVLSLPYEKYKESLETYLGQSKPLVLKKYSNKWISSSTWKKEFTSNKEFVERLNKMKKQLSKYIKKKGVSITLVNLDKLPSSVHRVPFTANLKEHEFEYDFPISLDQFATLKTLYSEIWFANLAKKEQLVRIGRKENPNKFTVCMIADSSSYTQTVQLTSPSGEDTETEIKTDDCIYIPSGWSFNFNVKSSTKFVTWVYE